MLTHMVLPPNWVQVTTYVLDTAEGIDNSEVCLTATSHSFADMNWRTVAPIKSSLPWIQEGLVIHVWPREGTLACNNDQYPVRLSIHHLRRQPLCIHHKELVAMFHHICTHLDPQQGLYHHQHKVPSCLTQRRHCPTNNYKRRHKKQHQFLTIHPSLLPLRNTSRGLYSVLYVRAIR